MAWRWPPPGKEHQHRAHAVDQVADDLGEAGDVDASPRGLEALAQRFELTRQLRVVQRPALASCASSGT
jgi:hypothetical protein